MICCVLRHNQLVLHETTIKFQLLARILAITDHGDQVLVILASGTARGSVLRKGGCVH